jgi:hypothetical protein
MAKCPECDLSMSKSPTKKAGMEVMKHDDPAAAKAAGCGVSFIPVRSKSDGGEKGKKRTEKEPVGTPAPAGSAGNKSGGSPGQPIREQSPGKSSGADPYGVY